MIHNKKILYLFYVNYSSYCIIVKRLFYKLMKYNKKINIKLINTNLKCNWHYVKEYNINSYPLIILSTKENNIKYNSKINLQNLNNFI
jgi:hypothetical protein